MEIRIDNRGTPRGLYLQMVEELQRSNHQIRDDRHDLWSRESLAPERKAELEAMIRGTRIDFQLAFTGLDHPEKRLVLQEILQAAEGANQTPVSQIIGEPPEHLKTGPLPDEFVENFFHEYLVGVLLKGISVPGLEIRRTVVPNIIIFLVWNNRVKITHMALVEP